MKQKYLLSVGLLSLIFVLAIAPTANSLTGRTFIAAITGDVQIKRRFWFGYRRVDVGETLWLNDRLWVKNQQSSAKVICNSQTPWNVPAAREVEVSEGCPAIGYRSEDNLAPGRSSENAQLPYLIRSRNTAIFPDRPLVLEWNPVAGATQYDVAIKYLSRTIWETQVSEPRAEYSNLSELQRNRDYFIVITAHVGNTTIASPEGTAPAPTLTPLSDEELNEVEAGLAKLESLNLDADAEALAIASLYQSYHLNQDAIDVLEEQIQAGTDKVALYQLQAELYQGVGLYQLAQSRYEKALNLAETYENLPQQAELQEQLGRLARNQENFAQAVEHLRVAKAIYQSLFDTTVVESQSKLQEIQRLIDDSQSRLSAS